MVNLREHWALPWRNRATNLGISVSSPVESSHNSLKSWLISKKEEPLVDIIIQIMKHESADCVKESSWLDNLLVNGSPRQIELRQKGANGLYVAPWKFHFINLNFREIFVATCPTYLFFTYPYCLACPGILLRLRRYGWMGWYTLSAHNVRKHIQAN